MIVILQETGIYYFTFLYVCMYSLNAPADSDQVLQVMGVFCRF